MTPRTQGTVSSRFDSLRAAFDEGFRDQPEMGAALAVYSEGRLVVDLWRGLADRRTGARWQEDTTSVIFSCTKGLTSILAARLVQEGRLDYHAPVAAYWPEFAAAGKDRVTVADILSHRSGVSAPREPLTAQQITEWSTVTGALAAQEPLWEPGSGYAYHAITHGWLAGEVIRRVTGMTIGDYFRETVAVPLDVDAWIGLPDDEQHRVAPMTVGSSLAQLIEQQAAARTPGVVDWGEQAMTLGGALAPSLVGDGEGFNSPAIRAAQIPGAGGVATARSLASIWSATIVPAHGDRLLDDATIGVATQVRSEGAPVWNVPGPWPRWGMGFQLDSEARRYLSAQSFGHDGAGGQVAFADPASQIGFAYVTNQMEAIDDQRATRIIDELRRIVSAQEA